MATELDEGSTGARRPRRPHVPRQLIAFIGVLCAGVLIGWVVFGDDDSTPAPATTTASSPRVAVKTRLYPKLGITLGLPTGWKTSFRGSVLTAVSRDETVSVALSVAGGPGDGQRIRRSDRTELARLFNAREVSRQRAKVGTATTIATDLIGRARNRRPIRILSMGPASRWHTYSIQAFTVLQPTPVRLAELRTLLGSVRYRQPR